MQDVAIAMRDWQAFTSLDEAEQAHLQQSIVMFDHAIARSDLHVGGVDGSGDFPLLTYADSFVYFTVAQGVSYAADRVSGLREVGTQLEPITSLAWLPEHQSESNAALEAALEALAGLTLSEVVERSDYRTLKSSETGRSSNLKTLMKGLIRPHASDSGNLAIQLRTTGELGAALRLLSSELRLDYLLVDTTFSLPLVSSASNSLFYEHLKRLCCCVAREQGTGFFALSKSHGLRGMDRIESLVREQEGKEPGQVAEHWYLRIPEPERDGWQLSLAEGRRLPPPGAVSYLVRFHRTTPVMRLDMDRVYWETHVKGTTEAETRDRERRIFEDLDYACHDQRVYGYPYPIKAAHDRASLTNAERLALRKQLIAEAMKQGMNPALFRDASQATGHR